MIIEVLRSPATWNDFERHPDLVQIRFQAENALDAKAKADIWSLLAESPNVELRETPPENAEGLGWLCLTIITGEKK